MTDNETGMLAHIDNLDDTLADMQTHIDNLEDCLRACRRALETGSRRDTIDAMERIALLVN